MLLERGLAHERDFLERLREAGVTVLHLDAAPTRWLVQVGIPLPACEKSQDKISPGLPRAVLKLALESREGIKDIEFCRHPRTQGCKRERGRMVSSCSIHPAGVAPAQ
jgi:hypothetical protein